MESVNYTYEKKKCRKSGIANIYHWLECRAGRAKVTIPYDAWVVIDKNGRKFAEAPSKKNAELIVAALNGVAP